MAEPEVWLVYVKSRFTYLPITSPRGTFGHVVYALTPQNIIEVNDVVVTVTLSWLIQLRARQY